CSRGLFAYWNEKTNPSGGNLIIQKYDDFAGLLPPCKPADLSPLERNPCWHTRRDMNILSNGDVISCRECVLSNVVGNVFKESLEEVWHKNDDILVQHIGRKYNELCGKCDESYTYNF
ncbi:MAG: SPASM domain-containing protein, partial [Treponema sp.]|nr:SPASM domain-containing protein [Treponema sp.]